VWLIYGFTKVNSFDFIISTAKNKFTIVVPFRNEADNLPLLLDSFSKLNYPNDLFEVILVDDESKEQFSVQSFQFSSFDIKTIRLHSP
jgi:cellulose synthase/poly-beta-1,6-N-acetylglucosamine synthase-like glycosyltransferase